MRVLRPLLPAVCLVALSGCQLLPSGDSGDNRRIPPTINRGSGPAPSVPGQQCLARLSATGATYSPLPNRFDAPGCTQIDSVTLSGLQGDVGSFATDNLGPVTCETASTFAGWTRYGVDRAARAYLGSTLARIETYGSYSCRNVAGSTRRSAHARAEAIDVAAFVLADGRRIVVDGDWSGGTADEREFLRVVRDSACKRFGTVLSPDYDAAHADHLHLEVGGGSFCR
ncbi:extensin-like domain-containing protein [Alteriqipengyuania lutimaris]|uniref:Extensin n=1 Tax=Alteriqipengyuania lutimaris TaxID=1538146 RepID=A0A395LQ39_9SPHN|nr:extensin [Alteriqipengyuania lutimaris]